MTAALAIGCGLLGLIVGGYVNLLIDRVPRRQRLWPLRGPPALLPEPAGRPTVTDEADPPSGAEPRVEGDRSHAPSPSQPVLVEGEGEPAGDDQAGDDQAGDDQAGDDPAGDDPAGGAARRANASRFLVHLSTGLVFAATAVHFGATWVLPAYLVFFTSLLAISVIDMEHHIIPNRIVYPTIFVSVPLLVLAAAADGSWSHLRAALMGGAIAWAAMLVIHLVSPAGMGFGDVRLSFVLGMFLGWLGLAKVLIGLFLGFLLGSVIGLLLIAVKLRTRKDHIPFGPFLAAGATLAVFFGGPISRWWLHGG